MKKNLFLLLSFSLAFLPGVYAAPSFSENVLQKAYEQVQYRIDQKVRAVVLDESSKKIIEAKKQNLTNILVSIDTAFRERDKAKLREQVKLFRDSYKEALYFIQNSKNNQQTSTSADTIGKTTDITYYANFFEGRKTANGNLFSQAFFSAAACNIPFNTLLQVGREGNSVIVKINDRPNCTKHPNITDLTRTAFGAIGKVRDGTRNILGVVSKNYTKKTLPINTFHELWITLNSNIPNTYLKNETLHITGKELGWKEYTILYLKSPSGKDITIGAKKWSDGSFEYAYPLEEIGVYELVIASWSGFDTGTFLEITVLEDAVFAAKKLTSSTKISEKLESLEIERVESPNLVSTYLFHLPSLGFHTLSIKSAKETFVYRGFWTIAIRSDALRSLDTNKPVLVKIDSQESSTSFSHDTFTNPVTIFEKTMTLTPGYKEEKNENIIAREEGGNLIIRGIIPKGKNVKGSVFLTLPNGNVEKSAFDAPSIDTDGYMKREKVFEKSIPLKQAGLYHIEINYDTGFAAYNGPFTYGEILPVYPNEYDGVQKEIGKPTDSVVATESLKAVNSVRARSGKSALSLDDTLSNLAIIKANDMARHQNVSHTDSAGDTIIGTAKRNHIQIAGSVGENVAWGNVSFRVLLIGLENSGGHRANMLDAWKRIGVGYAVKDGQVYYAQVFGE